MAPNGRVELADILRTHGQAYLAKHSLGHSKAKAWRAIIACRTEALGGHIERCDSCNSTRHVYHSCRNRHCPKCQTRTKEQWLAARQRECLSVPYTHVVFTVPHKKEKLAQCRLALQMPAPQVDMIESVQAFMLRVMQVDLSRCPYCGTGIMCVMAAIAPLRHCANPATGPPP